MFWTAFYWTMSFVFYAAAGAISFGVWHPQIQDIAWAAFFGVAIGAHSIARQRE